MTFLFPLPMSLCTSTLKFYQFVEEPIATGTYNNQNLIQKFNMHFTSSYWLKKVQWSKFCKEK